MSQIPRPSPVTEQLLDWAVGAIPNHSRLVSRPHPQGLCLQAIWTYREGKPLCYKQVEYLIELLSGADSEMTRMCPEHIQALDCRADLEELQALFATLPPPPPRVHEDSDSCLRPYAII